DRIDAIGIGLGFGALLVVGKLGAAPLKLLVVFVALLLGLLQFIALRRLRTVRGLALALGVSRLLCGFFHHSLLWLNSSRCLLAAVGLLGEVVAQFLEETLSFRADVLVLELGELTEQLFLTRGELAWGLHDDFDQLIAPPAAGEIGHAAPPEPEP